MANRTIRLIAFDLGGVLIDVKKPEPSSAFFEASLFDAFTKGQIPQSAYFSKVSLNLRCSKQEVERAFKDIVRVRPFCSSLIQSLATPFTIWSNINACHFEHIVAQCRILEQRARPSGLSFELGHLKPEVAFFDLCLKRMREAPAQILFLDDKISNVATAKSLGIDAVLVENDKEVINALAQRALLISIPKSPSSLV